mgnify:CR=1 FL=1|tara:strand:+ start:3660 stop:4322 length:663 start_codon:yes stop_codon:yes gene_type:complete
MGQPLVVLADEQMSGRGRLGRSWEGGPGNLLVSFALPISQDVASFAMMIAAREVAVFVQDLVHEKVQVKWPNDVLINGQKVAGIIGEFEQAHSCLLLGLGMNIQSTPHVSDARHRPTSLADHGFHEDVRQELCKCLCGVFSKWLENKTPTEHIVERLEEVCFPKGSYVRLLSQSDALEGSFDGLTREGHLKLVDSKGDQHVVVAGDVLQCRLEDKDASGY